MKWKIRALIFCYFSTVGVLIPFLPLLFSHRGLSPGEIGILLALGPFVSILVQSPWGLLSDRLQTVKKIIIIQMIATLFLSLLLFNLNSFYMLIPTAFVFYAFFLPTFPLIDCLILATIKETGDSFGSYRLWGSLGFAVTALSVGLLLANIGIERVGYVYMGLMLLSLMLAIPVADAPPTGQSFNPGQLRKLLTDRRVITVLVFIAIINSTNRANDTFMSLLIESLGGTEAIVGQAWTVAPLSEVPIFALFGFFLARGKEELILALGAAFYALRWFLFAITSNPDLITIIQLLHGLSFGLFYMAGVSYIGKIVPPGLRASGQGLLATFGGGIAGITGALAGGIVMDLYGPKTLYFGNATVALLSVLIFTVLILRKKDNSDEQGSRAGLQ